MLSSHIDRWLILAVGHPAAGDPGVYCPLAGQISAYEVDRSLTAYVAQPAAAYFADTILNRALAFEAAVRSLHAIADIIPMQFCEPRSRIVLDQWLAENEHRLCTTLAAIVGTCQLNVRWQIDSRKVSSIEQTNATTGKDYLRQRAQSTQAQRQLEETLTRMSEQVKIDQPTLRAAKCVHTKSGSTDAVIGLDCWIERDAVAATQQWLATLKYEHQLPVYISSQLPPYSFV